MTMRRVTDKPNSTPHVDQEKSVVDVFEHVIRGVRLNRLRDLLRRGCDDDDDAGAEADVWLKDPQASPA